MKTAYYIDTNVFIAAIQLDPNAMKILLDVATGVLKASTSCLTWDEFVWTVRKTISIEASKDKGDKFLAIPNLEFIDVRLDIIQKAQELARTHGLKPRDSIHVACAMSKNIKEIITDDQDFNGIDGLKRIPIVEFFG